MRTLLLASVLAAAAGCAKTDRPPAAPIAQVSVDELDQLLARHDGQAVDANEATTRHRMGVIPGAVLLTRFDSIDALPADKSKTLVFYCANPACDASHEAAEQAALAGYTHVKVPRA
jgi:rhodanese-related sulfurtransferase